MNESALQTLKANLKKKPHVNSTCIGCSACTAISWTVFELDENGLSCEKNLPSYEGYDVDDSIAACPVNAISWQEADETGEYTNGLKEHADPV
jgi:ferredoxin